MRSVAAILALGAILSPPSSADTCLEKIAALNSKPEITAAQATCMNLAPGFAEATALLCNRGQKDISSQYSRYLLCQRKYQEAFVSYSREEDPTQKGKLLFMVQQADNQ